MKFIFLIIVILFAAVGCNRQPQQAKSAKKLEASSQTSITNSRKGKSLSIVKNNIIAPENQKSNLINSKTQTIDSTSSKQLLKSKPKKVQNLSAVYVDSLLPTSHLSKIRKNLPKNKIKEYKVKKAVEKAPKKFLKKIKSKQPITSGE